MSIEAINWVFDLQDVTPSEKLVLLSLANRANNLHVAWPSWARLMRDTGLSRKSIYRLLDSLIIKGHIMKTGNMMRQVHVYKLCGISLPKTKEKLSTTSVTMTPVSQSNPCHHDTGTRVTMTPPPVSPRHLEPKLESKEESKGENSIFSPIQKQIQNQLIKHGLEPTQDIVQQIEFYVDQKTDQPEEQTIRVAVSLHKKNQWKIPNGYLGITSQSIAEKENEYQKEKIRQIHEDAEIFKSLKSQDSPVIMQKIEGETEKSLKERNENMGRLASILRSALNKH
jgi:hypothetical protein